MRHRAADGDRTVGAYACGSSAPRHGCSSLARPLGAEPTPLRDEREHLIFVAHEVGAAVTRHHDSKIGHASLAPFASWDDLEWLVSEHLPSDFARHLDDRGVRVLDADTANS